MSRACLEIHRGGSGCIPLGDSGEILRMLVRVKKEGRAFAADSPLQIHSRHLMKAAIWSCSLIVVASLCFTLSPAQEKRAVGSSDAKVPTVISGDVLFTVAKSSIGADERKWTLVLEATSKGADRKIMIQTARAITPEGKTLEIRNPMGKRPVSLPEDTKILIELSMGDLPKTVSSLARVELIGDRMVGVPGLEFDRKAKGKQLEPRPLVLRDVRVDRPGK